jgi:hypothetical protein
MRCYFKQIIQGYLQVLEAKKSKIYWYFIATKDISISWFILILTRLGIIKAMDYAVTCFSIEEDLSKTSRSRI